MHRVYSLLKEIFQLLVVLVIVYEVSIFIQVIWYSNHAPKNTAFMKAEQSRLNHLNPPKKIQHKWVSYKSISIYAKQAVIASEDANFTQHDGVDWEALEKAAKINASAGKIKKGGSTITMQLSKNLFLSSERSYFRKAEEFLITGMLELVLDKKRILEIYLNVAEWGIGIFGIESASNHYFGISASQLNANQAAWLAAILPAPRRFDQLRNSYWADQKAQIIMQRMPYASIPR